MEILKHYIIRKVICLSHGLVVVFADGSELYVDSDKIKL